MIKIFYTLSFLFLISFYSFSQNIQLDWVKAMGGSDADEGQSIVVDVSGCIYRTGFFNGTVDFEPGLGTTNLTSYGRKDIFVQKLFPDGSLFWAIRIGSEGDDEGKSIQLDNEGNLLITGYFNNSVDFDPGSKYSVLTSSGVSDAFVLKLNGFDGSLVWAKKLGGTSYDYGYSIATNNQGDVFVSGAFNGSGDFDPGPGQILLQSNGGSDVFIMKFNSSGAAIWGSSVGGAADDFCNAMTTDSDGSVIMQGSYKGKVDFDPGTGVYNLTSKGTTVASVFYLKLASSGLFEWAKTIWAVPSVGLNNISIDASGNIYSTGSVFGTTDMDPETGISNLIIGGTNMAMYVLKLSSSGVYIWSKAIGAGANAPVGEGIVIDTYGDIYVAGRFEYGDFDPGEEEFYMESKGSTDAFLLKLNSTGDFLWANKTGAANDDGAMDICLDASGSLYITGYYSASVNFNFNGKETQIYGYGNRDIYVQKIRKCSNSPTVITVTSCDYYTNNGRTYSSSGIYYQYFARPLPNCDSVVMINLTIFNGAKSYDTINATACYSYVLNGHTYYESGKYTQKLKNRMGCDSIITLNLTIKRRNARTEIIGGSLKAVSSTAGVSTYQWYSCGTAISAIQGAQEQTYTPTENGDYMAVITSDGCPDTSTCFSYNEPCQPGVVNFNQVSVFSKVGSIFSIYSTVSDAWGNIYSAGIYADSADFDFGPGTSYAYGSTINAFVFKIDINGNFLWAKTIAGNISYGFSIDVDISGNVYLQGSFMGTSDFDPGIGVENLTSVAGYDMFILKLDAIGNFVWVKQIDDYKSTAIIGNIRNNALDVTSWGDVYVAGAFEGTTDFDPGSGIVNYTSVSGFDFFIVKLNTAGEFQWVRTIGGNSEDINDAVATDQFGNVFFTGAFTNTVDLDPGAGTNQVSYNGSNSRYFLVKLNPAGQYEWGRVTGGERIFDLEVAGSGSIYTCGNFAQTIDFDPGSGSAYLSTAGSYDGYVAKFDANGNYQWAKKMNDSKVGGLLTLSVSPDEYVYTAGFFNGTVSQTINSKFTTFPTRGADDVLILKFNSSGLVQWAKQIGGNGHDYCQDLCIDPENSIMSAGVFSSTVDFDPGSSKYNVSAINYDDPFLHKMVQCGSLITGTDEESNAPAIVDCYSLFPNPGRGAISLMLNGKQPDLSRIERIFIVNSAGVVVYESKNIKDSLIELPSMSAGIYTAIIYDGNEIFNIKFVRE